MPLRLLRRVQTRTADRLLTRRLDPCQWFGGMKSACAESGCGLLTFGIFRRVWVLMEAISLDLEPGEPVHQWRRMPSCDEFVGARWCH